MHQDLWSRSKGMDDLELSRVYVQRVFAIQIIGIVAAFLTIWLAVGGLAGAIVAGLICAANAVSLNVLLHLIRRIQ